MTQFRRLLSSIPLILLTTAACGGYAAAADAGAGDRNQGVFDGLLHSSLGQAELGVVPGGLMVSNIGSSGNDGVSIDLPGNRGWHCDAVIDTPTLVKAVFRGEVGGLPDQPLARHRAEMQADGSISLSVDFSTVGATTSRWELYLDGEPVRIDTGEDNGSGHQVKWYPLGNDFYYVDSCCPGEYDHISVSGLWTMVYFTKNKSAETDTLEILADRIDIYPEDPQIDPGPATSVELTVAGPPSFIVTREQVEEFGHLHEALGAIEYEDAAGERKLRHCCLGSSGEDGAGIQLGRVAGGDVQWEELDPSGSAPAGAFLRFVSRGRNNGQDGQDLGSIQFTNDGSGFLAISADLTPVGSPTQTIRVLSGGTMVFEVAGHSGPVGGVSAWPRSCGEMLAPSLSLRCGWESLVVFMIDGAVVLGDELRVVSESAVASVQDISEFTVTGGDLGMLVITDEPVSDLPTAVEAQDGAAAPGVITWRGAVPNPFNPKTMLSYSLSRAASVELRLFDARGALVRTLLTGVQSAGEHSVAWDGTDDQGRHVVSGIYLSELRAAGETVADKLMLVK